MDRLTVLLVRVTDIPATEAQALRSRGEDYRRYQQETSVFRTVVPAASLVRGILFHSLLTVRKFSPGCGISVGTMPVRHSALWGSPKTGEKRL